MAEPTADEIASQVRQELGPTAFACSSLTPLSGGNANFIFRAKLQKPLHDGTAEIAIKHGEGFVALSPALKLSTSRCVLEQNCLEALQKLAPVTTQSYSVRTPALFLFNEGSSTQVQEYLPDSLNLKHYALKRLPPSTPPHHRDKVLDLGQGLGTWLRSFHEWSSCPEQEALQERAKANKELQTIKFTYNYESLMWQSDEFPFLKDAEGVFKEVVASAKLELEDDGKLHVIHGDFWTGNILLRDRHIDDRDPSPVFVVDWEMCQLGVRPLDLGQMIAEMYELFLYKDIRAALWLIEGFATGYGFVDDNFAFRTAVHVGAHLVGFGTSVPGWGDREAIERVSKAGRDLVTHGWARDRDWFEAHDLSALFRK